MKSSEFCYWLQGYIEIGHDQFHQVGLNHDQVEIIKRHLALVFKHELDGMHGDQAHQDELNQIHGPKFGGIGPDGEIYRC